MSTAALERLGLPDAGFDLRFGALAPAVRSGADRILADIQVKMAALGVSSFEEYKQAVADGRIAFSEGDTLTALYTRLKTVVDTGSLAPSDWGRMTEVSSFPAPGDLAMMHAMGDGRLLVRVQNEGVGTALNGYHVLDSRNGAIALDSKHTVMKSTWVDAYKEVRVASDDTVLFVRKKNGGPRDVWTWEPHGDQVKRVGKIMLASGDTVYAHSAHDCLYISHWNTHDVDQIDIATGELMSTISPDLVLFGRQMRDVISTGGFVFTVGGKDVFINASGDTVMHPPVPLAYLSSFSNGDILCQKRVGDRLDEFSDVWIYRAKYDVWQPLVQAPEPSICLAQASPFPGVPDVFVISFTDTRTAWLCAVDGESGNILWNQETKLLMNGTGLFPRLSVSPDGKIYLSDNDTVHVFGEGGLV